MDKNGTKYYKHCTINTHTLKNKLLLTMSCHLEYVKFIYYASKLALGLTMIVHHSRVKIVSFSRTYLHSEQNVTLRIFKTIIF